MQHEGHLQGFLELVETLEVELGDEALGIVAVSRADGDCEGVTASARNEVLRLLDVRVQVIGDAVTVGGLADVAEFGLD